MYSNMNTVKEFVATNPLTLNGEVVGYKGNLSIRGKRSNTIDITNMFLKEIDEVYSIKLNDTKLGKSIALQQDGNHVFSDKDCPILTRKDMYKIMGFNRYLQNHEPYQQLFRNLTDTYNMPMYKHIIIIQDVKCKDYVHIDFIGVDAIEITVNPILIKDNIENYLLYALLYIHTFYTNKGAVDSLVDVIQTYNQDYNLMIPYTNKIQQQQGTVEYYCTSCLEIKQVKRKLLDITNYRCKCGGILQKNRRETL